MTRITVTYFVTAPDRPSREFNNPRAAFEYFKTLTPVAHSSISLHAVSRVVEPKAPARVEGQA